MTPTLGETLVRGGWDVFGSGSGCGRLGSSNGGNLRARGLEVFLVLLSFLLKLLFLQAVDFLTLPDGRNLRRLTEDPAQVVID